MFLLRGTAHRAVLNRPVTLLNLEDSRQESETDRVWKRYARTTPVVDPVERRAATRWTPHHCPPPGRRRSELPRAETRPRTRSGLLGRSDRAGTDRAAAHVRGVVEIWPAAPFRRAPRGYWTCRTRWRHKFRSLEAPRWSCSAGRPPRCRCVR